MPVPPAYAASFDCQRAKTAVENAICADADVSRQDSLLQDTYQKVLQESAEPEKIRTAQREWLKQRDKCGGQEPSNTICLSLAYSLRRGQLETALFLERQIAKKGTADAPRYPDIWLARFEDRWLGYTRRVFRLERSFQQKLGLRAEIDDYFFLDFQPDWKASGRSKYVLRGFFNGAVVPVRDVKRSDSALVSASGIAIPGEMEVRPLLPSVWGEIDLSSIGLKDLKLQSREYYLWHTGPHYSDGSAPCERAKQALELVDVAYQIIWSKVFILDAGKRWYATCGGIGHPAAYSPEEWAYNRRLVTYYWNDSFSLQIYPLNDGTFFVSSGEYLLRLRFDNGQFDRAGAGAIAVDSAKMMELKRAFKVKWSRLHGEAQKKFFNCMGSDLSPAKWSDLTKTKCKILFDDPYASDMWYRELNAEIERTLLYPALSQHGADPR